MSGMFTKLNRHYVLGRIPSLNLLVLGVQILALLHVASNYNAHIASKPLLTSMVVNSLLTGFADALAQTILAFRHRRSHSLPPVRKDKEKNLSISVLPSSSDLFSAQPFNFERLIRFKAWGFITAAPQFLWFSTLSAWFPMEDGEGVMLPIAYRVAMDQLLYTPVNLVLFFCFMTVAEGGGKKAVVRKFRGAWWETLRSNYVLWPPVQVLNFRVCPVGLQLPFVASVGVFWNTYLSMKNDAADI